MVGIQGLVEGASMSLGLEDMVASVSEPIFVVPFACEGDGGMGTSTEIFRRVAMLLRKSAVLLMPSEV